MTLTVDQMMGNVPDEDDIGSKPIRLNKQPKRVPIALRENVAISLGMKMWLRERVALREKVAISLGMKMWFRERFDKPDEEIRRVIQNHIDAYVP